MDGNLFLFLHRLPAEGRLYTLTERQKEKLDKLFPNPGEDPET